MNDRRHHVEFFVPAPACSCSGQASLRHSEKLSRLESLMSAMENAFPSVEITRYAMTDDEGYAEGLRRLAAYLVDAGEEDFASRVAFSLRYVLPAVAVDGKLVAYGRVPDLEEVLQAFD
ncbi:MAG: hypothetical protein WHT46_01220 [Candidatus Geothermincolales bacterium]